MAQHHQTFKYSFESKVLTVLFKTFKKGKKFKIFNCRNEGPRRGVILRVSHAADGGAGLYERWRWICSFKVQYKG